MHEVVLLACGDCKRRNYATTKNRKKHPEKMEFRKLCPWCGKHTAHKETKAS